MPTCHELTVSEIQAIIKDARDISVPLEKRNYLVLDAIKRIEQAVIIIRQNEAMVKMIYGYSE